MSHTPTDILRAGLRPPRRLAALFAAALLDAILLAAILLPAALLAQDAAPADASGEEAVTFEERIDVRLVQIPILARDARNRPITDLSPDELVIKDRGQKMEVAFLEPFYKEVPQAPLPDVRIKLDLPGGAATVARAGEREPRYMIFYIDVENDQPLGKAQATQDLIRFIMEEVEGSTQIAVLSFNGEIHLDQPFTSDKRAATLAIRNAFDRQRRPQITLRLRIEQLIENLRDCVESRDAMAFERDADIECMRTIGLEYADEVRPRAEDFLAGLEGLVRFAGGLDGRKSVVAVSHGVAANPAEEVTEAARALVGNNPDLASLRLELMGGEGVRQQMDDTVDLAIRNEVTLHFIDRTRAPSSDYGARQGELMAPGAQPVLAAHRAPQGDLREIALTTGGIFLATTDLYDGVRQAVDLERGGYYLGYYADAYLPRNELAKVSVSSTRRGVRISHRRGVYAKPREGAEDVFRGRIALGRPQRLAPERGDGLHVPFQIFFQPHDIGYTDNGAETMVASFTVHFLVEQGNRQVAGSYHFVEHGYPKSLWVADDIEPVVIPGWVEIPKGDFRLVAKVRNVRDGRGGQLVQELKVAERGNDEAVDEAADEAADETAGDPGAAGMQ